MKYLICLAFVLFGLSRTSISQVTRADIDKLAQQLDSFTQKNIPTSLYLRASKDIYLAGEDLWFNAFVLHAADFTLSPLDKTLYLQLQQVGSDSVLWQEMYPVSNGLSAGHVYLPQTLTSGDYLLKGYTVHSFLRGQSYYYAVACIRVVNEPREIRSRKQQPGHASKEAIQFQLFPEGGNLVAGVQNQVAFKAVNKAGYPVDVKGTLLKENTPVLDFRTEHAGMGSFLFTPEKNTTYHIRLAENKDSLYSLPMAAEGGISIHLVKNEEDSLTFKVISPHTHPFYLRLQVRGAVASIAAGTVSDSAIVKMSIHDAPQGIGEVTLFDGQLRPVAERLVYLHPEQQFGIHFSDLKAQYHPKEKVSIKVKTTDAAGLPVPAVFSLSVYDNLFHHAEHPENIVSYYYLSTQIRGRIYDPAYYFDVANKDRKAALDLLLLTQGWRRYAWNKDAMKEGESVLSDSLPGEMTATQKTGKTKQPVSLMLFNYNKTIMRVAVADNAGRFYLTPDHLAIGPRFFIKYISDKDYHIQVADPFETIRKAAHPAVMLPDSRPPTLIMDTAYIPYGKTLKEINVSAKGPAFSDRYLGYLDSIAKYEGNTDYVGLCGWLNCPDGRTNIKPVEGKLYHMFSPSVTSHQHVILTSENHKDVVYHYPNYTEEELLKKLKIVVAKGYYQHREFYEPDYDKESTEVSDTRNTLFWKPAIVTDKNGEATIEFFCSDVTRQFIGIAEGVTGAGVLGANTFSFGIR